MTPEAMARLHARAFTLSRPWTTAEFEALLKTPGTEVFTAPGGFALTRTVAGEAELLTIAVDPDLQRSGTGRRLMQDWLQSGAASEAFLEVSQDNIAALALYISCGFAEVARRNAYYPRTQGPAQDAIVMRKALP